MPASTWLPLAGTSLGFLDGGLTLAYSDADRTCCLTFTDAAMSGGRTSRCGAGCAMPPSTGGGGDASSLEIFSTTARPSVHPVLPPRRGQGHTRPANSTAAKAYPAES